MRRRSPDPGNAVGQQIRSEVPGMPPEQPVPRHATFFRGTPCGSSSRRPPTVNATSWAHSRFARVEFAIMPMVYPQCPSYRCRVTVDQTVPGAQPPDTAGTGTDANITSPIRVRPAVHERGPYAGEREPVNGEPDLPGAGAQTADLRAGRESVGRGVPVFVDPTGRRRRRIRVACYAGATICVGYLALVAVSMAGGAAGPRALLPFAMLGGGAGPGHVGGPAGAARPHRLPAATRVPTGGRTSRPSGATTPTPPASARAVPAPGVAVPAAVPAVPAIASAGSPSPTPPAPTRSAVPEATTTVPPTPTPTAQPTPLPGPRTTGRASTSPALPRALPAPSWPAPPPPAARSAPAPRPVPAAVTAPAPAAGQRL
ncbi:MAG: hypothetical protein QOE03_1041 [Micromonosporaceae bacterium]|nr:hypothetical protein [Micromonosporaceae bacterium]